MCQLSVRFAPWSFKWVALTVNMGPYQMVGCNSTDSQLFLFLEKRFSRIGYRVSVFMSAAASSRHVGYFGKKLMLIMLEDESEILPPLRPVEIRHPHLHYRLEPES